MQTPTLTVTDQVAARLHELCTTGKFHEAMLELYADNARQVEAMECPGAPYGRITQGKDNLLKMAEMWNKSTTVHSCTVSKPLVNDNQFICEMIMDCTSHEGPMAGQRMQMREYCLYTVDGGKITEAKFFYSMG
jgi:hypothetical protein